MMITRGVVLVLLLSCVGCAGQLGGTRGPVNYDPQILDGSAMFGETVPPAEKIDLLHMTPAMRQFARDDIVDVEFTFSRFRRLMEKMARNGYFRNQYDAAATFTAEETFRKLKGNCLSYTTLFIALAREAGLDAHYQVVYVPPEFDVNAGLLVRNNHINVVMTRIAVPGVLTNALTVDFNLVEPDPNVRRKKVSDAYAESLYYANVAVEYLQNGDAKQTFAFLKRAVLTEPNNPDAWNNLGTLYSMEGYAEEAIEAFKTVLQIDGRNKTAYAGLARNYGFLNQTEEAQKYAAITRKYQRKNPYYHFAMAEIAFNDESFEEALGRVNKAIALKRNNAKFYALRAATAEQLGLDPLAEQSKKLEAKHARVAENLIKRHNNGGNVTLHLGGRLIN